MTDMMWMQGTKRTRALKIAMSGIILLGDFLKTARSRGDLQFLVIFTAAVALMTIFSEIKGILEEPDEEISD